MESSDGKSENTLLSKGKILLKKQNLEFWDNCNVLNNQEILLSGRSLKTDLKKDIEGVNDCVSQFPIAIQSSCEKFISKLPINNIRKNWKATKI